MTRYRDMTMEQARKVREYAREYAKSPEAKLHRMEYRSRPEVKARIREYSRRYGREYYHRPDVQARRHQQRIEKRLTYTQTHYDYVTLTKEERIKEKCRIFDEMCQKRFELHRMAMG